jgi:hypothetical protein
MYINGELDASVTLSPSLIGHEVKTKIVKYVLESEHPYKDNIHEKRIVDIKGATKYVVTFDDCSKTERQDFVSFFADNDSNIVKLGEDYSGGHDGSDPRFPGVRGVPPLEIDYPVFQLWFKTDGSVSDWGWKCIIEAHIDSEEVVRYENECFHCANGHELVKVTDKPSCYNGMSVYCDVCKRKRIHEDKLHFYHCDACKYDLCISCAVDRQSKAEKPPVTHTAWDIATDQPASGSCNWMDEDGSNMFHFNPRVNERQLVMNTHSMGSWGTEERIPLPEDVVNSTQPLIARVRVTSTGYEISFNGVNVHLYRHRLPFDKFVRLDCHNVTWKVTSSNTESSMSTVQLTKMSQTMNKSIVYIGKASVDSDPIADSFVTGIQLNDITIDQFNPQRLREFSSAIKNSENLLNSHQSLSCTDYIASVMWHISTLKRILLTLLECECPISDVLSVVCANDTILRDYLDLVKTAPSLGLRLAATELVTSLMKVVPLASKMPQLIVSTLLNFNGAHSDDTELLTHTIRIIGESSCFFNTANTTQLSSFFGNTSSKVTPSNFITQEIFRRVLRSFMERMCIESSNVSGFITDTLAESALSVANKGCESRHSNFHYALITLLFPSSAYFSQLLPGTLVLHNENTTEKQVVLATDKSSNGAIVVSPYQFNEISKHSHAVTSSIYVKLATNITTLLQSSVAVEKLLPILTASTYDDRPYAAPVAGMDAVKIVESKHPYDDNMKEYWDIVFEQDIDYMVVKFDEQSSSEEGCDYVEFYSDRSKSTRYGTQYSGSSGSRWPGVGGSEPLKITAKKCVLYFRSDGSRNDWGFKVTVTGILSRKISSNLFLRNENHELLQKRYFKSKALDIVSSVISFDVARQVSPSLFRPLTEILVAPMLSKSADHDYLRASINEQDEEVQSFTSCNHFMHDFSAYCSDTFNCNVEKQLYGILYKESHIVDTTTAWPYATTIIQPDNLRLLEENYNQLVSCYEDLSLVAAKCAIVEENVIIPCTSEPVETLVEPKDHILCEEELTLQSFDEETRMLALLGTQ